MKLCNILPAVGCAGLIAAAVAFYAPGFHAVSPLLALVGSALTLTGLSLEG